MATSGAVVRLRVSTHFLGSSTNTRKTLRSHLRFTNWAFPSSMNTFGSATRNPVKFVSIFSTFHRTMVMNTPSLSSPFSSHASSSSEVIGTEEASSTTYVMDENQSTITSDHRKDASNVLDTPPSMNENTNTTSSDPIRDAADGLDIKVGRVLRAWRHPEADSLYVEEVDVGEPEPRIICSGLVKYIPLEQLQNATVLVLANLKPRNMRGVKSNGMLMAASDVSHENVELLVPPEGSIPGERIWFGLEEEKVNQSDAATPNQVQKKKMWETVQPHLRTDESCAVFLGPHPMRTSAGIVMSTTLKNANIS